MEQKSYTKYHREYYLRHKEERDRKAREYQRAHPEKIKEYKRKALRNKKKK